MKRISKLILMQCEPDGKEVCGNTQLCAGLEDGIKGAMHAFIQCANTNSTMRFPDEGTHTAASTGDPPPHTEPPNLGTHPTVNTPNATAVNPHTQPDP